MDLSSSTAERSSERMIHELHSVSHRGRPPHMALPLSARESHDEAIAATASMVAAPTAAAPVSARAGDVNYIETVENIVAAIEQVGPALYDYTTADQRASIRRATCPSNAPLERAVQGNPASSLLTTSLLAVGAGVVLGSMLGSSPARGFRGVSSSSRRAVDRMLQYA